MVFFSHVSVCTGISSFEDNPATISEIHVIFSNHFDAGYNDREWALKPPGDSPATYRVLNKYFDEYIPNAIKTAETMRQKGNDQFSWMTQQWIVALYLDCPASGVVSWDSSRRPLLHCPNATAIQRFKAAVTRGDIWFHAFPFNAELDIYDVSTVKAAFKMVQTTADELNIPRPRTISQRDVPGLPRAILPYLKEYDVAMVSLGSGGPSQGHPKLPELFMWRDLASGVSVLHTFDHGYGGGVHVLPNGVAIHCHWNGDNGGPHTAEEATKAYVDLRKKYPNAKIFASTFDKFLDVATPVLDKLPVITSEIGDTWEYGIPSDPLKNQQFREIVRRRSACIATGACDPNAKDFRRFDRLLVKIPEHTWGTDVPCYYGDFLNWTNTDFEAALTFRYPNGSRLLNYNVTIDTWLEQRSYIDNAIALLTSPQHIPFAKEIRNALFNLRPKVPSLTGFVKETDPYHDFKCNGIEISFSSSGSISKFVSAKGKLWEGSLGSFVYQTVNDTEYDQFGHEYGNFKNCDVPPNKFHTCQDRVKACGASSFVKVNMSAANPQRRQVVPQLSELWTDLSNCAFRLLSIFPSEPHINAGGAQKLWTSFDISKEGNAIHLEMTWFNKTATKLPEASWAVFDPQPNHSKWELRYQVLDQMIDPLDVVSHGATHLHGADAVYYSIDEHHMKIFSLDAPIVSLGLLSPFPTSTNGTIPVSSFPKFYYNLHNNIWETNYVQWYPFVNDGKSGGHMDDSASLFRFRIEFSD